MDSYPDGCPSKNPTAPCSFPFKYKGKMYNGCTTQDYGIRWCGTAHEVDIVHWAECSNACHDDDIQSEICILTHLGWIENGKVNGEAIERSIDSSLTDQP
ncbi:Epididymal spermbinding protein 1like, partial [Caligus rogercresseyi]